jgi:hypothetical protein
MPIPNPHSNARTAPETTRLPHHPRIEIRLSNHDAADPAAPP